MSYSSELLAKVLAIMTEAEEKVAQTVLDICRGNPEATFTVEDLAKQTGINKSIVFNALRLLIVAGAIERPKHGLYQCVRA